MLNREADIELKDALYGRPPLGEAALAGKLGVVTLLVEGGAEIDATDNAGRTALRLATAYLHPDSGGVELMDHLIAMGADINAREANGLTILGWAQIQMARDESYGAVVDVLLRKGATK